MAQLISIVDGVCRISELGHAPVALGCEAGTPAEHADLSRLSAVTPALIPFTDGRIERWCLVAAPSTCTVNGSRNPYALRVLHDRDEIRLASRERIWFSMESRADIAPYSGGADISCPRCLEEITVGAPSVTCPACGTVYHQNPAAERACWTYGACVCGRDSAPDADMVWSPEALFS